MNWPKVGMRRMLRILLDHVEWLYQEGPHSWIHRPFDFTPTHVAGVPRVLMPNLEHEAHDFADYIDHLCIKLSRHRQEQPGGGSIRPFAYYTMLDYIRGKETMQPEDVEHVCKMFEEEADRYLE